MERVARGSLRHAFDLWPLLSSFLSRLVWDHYGAILFLDAFGSSSLDDLLSPVGIQDPFQIPSTGSHFGWGGNLSNADGAEAEAGAGVGAKSVFCEKRGQAEIRKYCRSMSLAIRPGKAKCLSERSRCYSSKCHRFSLVRVEGITSQRPHRDRRPRKSGRCGGR